MQKLIHLFIGDKEVEFSSPPDILYTYQQTDFTNPTVIKNGFSKTVTIEGTPSNNQIFGHYWKVERLQNTSENGSGVYFNASKKIPFTLYLDSEIYEQGYVKLDNVKLVGHSIIYSITLYGGLGQFFYELSTDSEGNKKKLSNLEFDVDLNFITNINTVKEAWESLSNGGNEKWDTINFMPAYNGLPDDFDSDKVVFNTSGTSFEKKYYDGEGNTYQSKGDFVLGELPTEMTEWEIFDLRSYLQRPCIRMKKIIEACCKPENNGGYNVVLDNDFFNEDNPYWENTWLTLPMIQSLEYKNDVQEVEDSVLLNGSFDESSSNTGKMFQELYYNIGNMPETLTSSFSVRGYMTFSGFNWVYNYPYTSYVWYKNQTSNEYYSGFAEFGSLFVQLLAFNGNNIVGASQTYNLTSTHNHGGVIRWGDNSRYDDKHKYTSYMGKPIYNSYGWNNKGTWCYEGTENPIYFDFEINNCNSNITNLRLCYFWGSSRDKAMVDFPNGFFDKDWFSGKVEIHGFKTVDMNALKFNITSSSKAVMGESLGRTGTKVTKELLLNTESSPCDYLLSYCKMFGLYFRKDVENNTIYIETRKTFYDRNNVADLSELIDRSRDYSITPLSFETKWYEFKQKSDKTDFYDMYLTSRGVDYGCKILNTGYEFIADKKNLLNSNIIKSGIEGIERSRYFTTYNIVENKERLWFNEVTYDLYGVYGTDGTYEMKGKTSATENSTLFGINEGQGMKYYDLFPKLQFHDKKNTTTDGNNVLVFFSGFKKVKEEGVMDLRYILSDDNQYQVLFNEGNPCWLYTNYEKSNNIQICHFLSELPVFERYYTSVNSTTVNKSLDFGTPQELYVPNYSITEDTNIYSNFWRTYLEDLFDVNTRILTCYVKINGKPNPEWLRRFYWFDNSIWVLNKITDWNICGDGTTKMEFIKVQDLENYTSITQKKLTDIRLNTPIYHIDAEGSQFDITVEVTPSGDKGNSWRIINPHNGNENNDENFVMLSKNSGVGNDSVTVTVASNNSESVRTIYLTAINDVGQVSNITLYQSYIGETSFTTTPSNLVVTADKSTTEVSFKWDSQYNNNVNNYIDEGDIDILGITFEEYNKGVISINSNETDYVKSERITFISGMYEDSIGIDQLPRILEFDKDGTEIYTLSFKYNKPIFTELPYWINVVKTNDYEYRVMAKPNYYNEVLESTFKINGVGIAVRQAEGKAVGGAQESSVNPSSLYFEKEGGSQIMVLNTSGQWKILAESWFLPSQLRGNGSTILSVITEANPNETRYGVMRITCEDKIINVVISQNGAITTPTFTLNTPSVIVGKDGGVVRATFTYKDKGTDDISIEGNGTTVGSVEWYGEEGYVDITVPKNTTISQKTYELVFTNNLGDFIFTITQEAGDSYISTANLSSIVGYGGGTINNTINSNTEWSLSYDADWFTIEPTNGNGTVELNITVNGNENEIERSSVVTATTTDGKSTTFTVIQKKFISELSVTPSSITFDAEGGTATITINSNTKWIIEI